MNFKKIPKNYFSTILDRLTRFEPAYIRYERVFNDILNKFYLEKRKNFSIDEKIKIVEIIFNSSLQEPESSFEFNDIFRELEEKYFIKNAESYHYLSSRLNILQMIKETTVDENSCKNLIWLKEISKQKSPYSLEDLRFSRGLLYPVEKIILCEGQTEEHLLYPIFKLFGIDFNKIGIKVIAAGGKNQVARKYYAMREYLKIPFFILLDRDALSIKSMIEPKLKPDDKLYLINCGEFEDLIPKIMLQKVINYVHKNEYNCIYDDFCNDNSMVENLKNIYKKYGFGDFKKSEFSFELMKYIENNAKKEDFTDSEIINLIDFFDSTKTLQ